jgi:DNA-binding transcriptional ArsR family regulator
MSSQSDIDWPQSVYHALHHPLRRELLQYMAELDEPMSAVDYVKARGVDGKTEDTAISFVSYHLRQLHGAGMVDLVTTEAVRGANKYLYRTSHGFAATYGDTLAMNLIASLLGTDLTQVKAGVLRDIGEIVTSTGRSIASKGKPL